MPSGRRWPDLLLEIDDRLLVNLEEAVARPVEIDHEGDDRTKDDDQTMAVSGLRRTERPAP